MATKLITTAKIFLDTAYVIALSSPRDSFHRQAVLLAEEIETEGVKLVATQAISLEIGNALASKRHRQKAVSLLESLAQDENVDILPLTDALYRWAFQLFRNHTDKAWGMTDCTSFVVMREQGLTEALTADRHFEQAGFRALLKTPL